MKRTRADSEQLAHVAPDGAADENKRELDRLAELANIGVGHAADAFAQIVGRTMWVSVPVVRVDGPFISPGACAVSSSSGVFFRLDGCMDALIGILFSKETTEKLARKLLGIEEGALQPELLESALMEVGNILASHVASAIADTLGDRLLPSVPTLVLRDAEEAFQEFVTDCLGPDVVRIESELFDPENTICGRLIMVPAPR